MRVAAVDVGIVNCGFCVVSSGAPPGAPPPPPALGLLEQRLACGEVVVEEWQLVQLGSSKSASAASTFERLVEFLRAREPQLRDVDVLVVEQQMTARMKALSACFYGAVRVLSPSTKVVFQSASAKLNFGDLAAFLQQPSAPLSSYAQRKKLAVAVTRRLAAHCPAALRAAFLAAKKKDDFSDALLHALAGLCIHAAPQQQQPRAKAKAKAKAKARGTAHGPS
jgi:hypothetical protein